MRYEAHEWLTLYGSGVFLLRARTLPKQPDIALRGTVSPRASDLRYGQKELRVSRVYPCIPTISARLCVSAPEANSFGLPMPICATSILNRERAPLG
jgi:hypothetical protein